MILKPGKPGEVQGPGWRGITLAITKQALFTTAAEKLEISSANLPQLFVSFCTHTPLPAARAPKSRYPSRDISNLKTRPFSKLQETAHLQT